MCRKMLLAAATGAALLSLSVSAYATVPEISGTYAISFSAICQVTQRDGSIGTGFFTYSWWIADFDKKAGQAQITQTAVSGSVVVPSNSAPDLAQTTYNVNGPYSQTSTTFTLDGATYNVVYGLVVKGIAESFSFGGLLTGGAPCAGSGTATRTTPAGSLE